MIFTRYLCIDKWIFTKFKHNRHSTNCKFSFTSIFFLAMNPTLSEISLHRNFSCFYLFFSLTRHQRFFLLKKRETFFSFVIYAYSTWMELIHKLKWKSPNTQFIVASRVITRFSLKMLIVITCEKRRWCFHLLRDTDFSTHICTYTSLWIFWERKTMQTQRCYRLRWKFFWMSFSVPIAHLRKKNNTERKWKAMDVFSRFFFSFSKSFVITYSENFLFFGFSLNRICVLHFMIIYISTMCLMTSF